MNILLDCAWCGDEVVFTVTETDDELVCSACNTRMDFAPDPATTFGLLYEARLSSALADLDRVDPVARLAVALRVALAERAAGRPCPR